MAHSIWCKCNICVCFSLFALTIKNLLTLHPHIIVAGSHTPPSLTEYLVLHQGVGVIQVQEELLE